MAKNRTYSKYVSHVKDAQPIRILKLECHPLDSLLDLTILANDHNWTIEVIRQSDEELDSLI
jgi:hypothetical protein